VPPVPADGEDGCRRSRGCKAETKTMPPVTEAFMTARQRAVCLVPQKPRTRVGGCGPGRRTSPRTSPRAVAAVPEQPGRVRLRGTVTPGGRQPDRHLAGEPPADALAGQARQVRSARGSASLGRMSSVPGPPRRPAAATPACARRPGRDAPGGRHPREGAGRGRRAGQDAARGRHPGRDAARGRG